MFVLWRHGLKKCINCETELNDSDEKCPVCGVDQKGIVADAEEIKPARLNVLCIIGFAFSLITAAVFAFFATEIALAENIGVLVLIIVGIIAYGASAIVAFGFSLGGLIWTIKAKHRGKGFAIAALIIFAATIITLVTLFVILKRAE